MRQKFTQWFSLLAAFFMIAAYSSNAGAAPTAAEITGEIEHLTLNIPTDVYSGGVMVVGGHEVILPKNLLIDLPANRLTLQQIFDQAPALCKANGESGLAKADRCNASGAGGFATLSGVHSNAGNVIAADVLIEKGKEVASGVVSYISYTDGYFRVNGTPGSTTTGVMVRLNDPTSRHTVQQGLGCVGGPNCSADPRFTLDPDNYVIAFSSGYPVCIPSTVSRNFTSVAGLATSPAQSSPAGTGDALCPDTNRTHGVVVEPAVNDSRLFAPLLVGDSVTAEGNYETVNGTRFLSVHTMRVNKALSTKPLPTQPDYMFLEEVFVEAPGFQNQRARALIIGFTTLAPTDVDLWSIHRDPATNSIHEFPLASVKGCDLAAGAGTCGNQGLIGAGANIFRIRYDVDFLMAAAGNTGGTKDAKLNPCRHLKANPRFASTGVCALGNEFANNFAVMSPIPHEIQARTGHSLDNPGLITLDINGRPATNGQYLFPFGMNLGGIETADFLEIDINLLNTPRVFEGIPWNLDRRLSPSGCLAGGCEATPQPLDPFPYTGLDPRFQANFTVAGAGGGTPTGPITPPSAFTASSLTHAYDRVFSFVDPVLGQFNGNATLLPYVLGTFPADPDLIQINATPALTIFSPIAVNDSVVTDKNAPVNISVISNDVAVLGAIDPASVQIVASPTHGTLSAIFGGSVTYTPTPGYAGPDTFTYKVASSSGVGISGGYSNVATVSVMVVAPPAAANDAVTTFTNAPQFAINVIANDAPGTYPIDPASVNIVSSSVFNGTNTTCGSVNPGYGTLNFTPPSTPGTCTFSYTVSDSATPPQLSNVATVTVTVNPVSTLTANPDTAIATVNSTITLNVISNDTATSTAIDTAAANFIVDQPAQGTTSYLGNGIVQYIAPATTTGSPFTFNYHIKDVSGTLTSSSTVTVTVFALPAAADISPSAFEAGTSTLIDILAYVTPSASLVPATVAIAAAPAHGSVSVNPSNGTVTYSPNTGFWGTDTFTYNVKNIQGVVSNTATVTLTVTAPATESLTVTTAQYVVSSDTWQVDGTSTNHLGVVNVFNGSTVAAPSLGAATVDANGNWTLPLPVTGNQLPNPADLMISVQSASAPAVKQEGITLVVR